MKRKILSVRTTIAAIGLAEYQNIWEKRLDRLEEALEKKCKRSKAPTRSKRHE